MMHKQSKIRKKPFSCRRAYLLAPLIALSSSLSRAETPAYVSPYEIVSQSAKMPAERLFNRHYGSSTPPKNYFFRKGIYRKVPRPTPTKTRDKTIPVEIKKGKNSLTAGKADLSKVKIDHSIFEYRAGRLYNKTDKPQEISLPIDAVYNSPDRPFIQEPFQSMTIYASQASSLEGVQGQKILQTKGLAKFLLWYDKSKPSPFRDIFSEKETIKISLAPGMYLDKLTIQPEQFPYPEAISWNLLFWGCLGGLGTGLYFLRKKEVLNKEDRMLEEIMETKERNFEMVKKSKISRVLRKLRL